MTNSIFRTQSKRLNDHGFKNYLRSIEDALPTNSKDFWKYASLKNNL